MRAAEQHRTEAHYATPHSADSPQPFNPTRCERTANTLWIGSNIHRQQIGLRQKNGHWHVAERREVTVPQTTRTSLPIGDRHYAIDAVRPALRVRDTQGQLVAEYRIAPNSYRMGQLGPGYLWLLSRGPHRISTLDLHSGRLTHTPLVAPMRDAAFDSRRNALWIVGSEQKRVRRNTGPIRNLSSVALAVDATALRQGQLHVRRTIDLSTVGAVDATAARVSRGVLYVTATGSDHLIRITETAVSKTVAGMAPWALCTVPTGIAVVSRLDDTVLFFDHAGVLTQRLELDSTPRLQPADLGERLFYSAGLWHRNRTRYTCNTCHWTGGSDGRIHPGFLERRQELTRPLFGIAAVRPIFSTAGAPSLTDATEGLIRGLDDRAWNTTHAYWYEPRRVTLKGHAGKGRMFSAREIRVALIRYLSDLPVPTPAKRQPGSDFSTEAKRGWALFRAHCASCHQPQRTMRQPSPAFPTTQTRLTLNNLANQPAALGYPGTARTGVEPYFTKNGNRITPLIGLSRLGPFFTNGSSSTLRDVLRRFRPNRTHVHGRSTPTRDSAEPTAAPRRALKAHEVEALEAFLLSI